MSAGRWQEPALTVAQRSVKTLEHLAPELPWIAFRFHLPSTTPTLSMAVRPTCSGLPVAGLLFHGKAVPRPLPRLLTAPCSAGTAPRRRHVREMHGISQERLATKPGVSRDPHLGGRSSCIAETPHAG